MAKWPTTCELLGFPEDAKLLIVNCDDFGLCHGENAGTVQAIRDGIGSSCSLMLPAPWSQHAMHLLSQYQFPFAVHLTLVSEYQHLRWGPVLPRQQVPSLLDDSGYFHLDYRFKQHLPDAEPEEIEAEFRAQIDRRQASFRFSDNCFSRSVDGLCAPEMTYRHH